MKSIIYIGMDVHTTNFTLCSYTIENDQISHVMQVAPDYRNVLSYLEKIRFSTCEEVEFVCGYEAGCLGYTLYHDLTNHGVKCIILAPTTMANVIGKKKMKTDRKDAALIAKCLAYHTYSPVHVPTDDDEQVKDYIRMRDDHKLALKKIKQQIIAFCTRHNYKYDGTKHNWTQKHLSWLKALKPNGLYQEVLAEYLVSYEQLSDKIEYFDQRIEEIANTERYQEDVSKLRCFIGVNTYTALAVVVETGDFGRFATAEKFASYLGLVPGENSSGDNVKRTGITKAGNRLVRKLLVESAQCFQRGAIGHKSKALKERQFGNPTEVIAYADKGNERLRRKYQKMVFRGINSNVAKTAVARELACFMWGMMTENIA